MMTEVKQPEPPPKTVFDRVGEVMDRLVYAFHPEAGIRRMAMRRAHDERQGRRPRYAANDGAESTNTRGSSWLASRLSVDSGLELDLETLKRNSRELYRTDSIGGAVDTRKNLVVSYGFTPQAKIAERKRLGVTAKQAEEWNEELEEVYERLAPRISKCGKRSLWQLCRLVEGCHGYDGESLTILSDRGDVDKPVPLTLEVVDTDRLCTPDGMVGNPRVRLGVEYDATGKIVAYHILDAHPGDTIDVKRTWTRYPADRVLHVFEPWFAGQSRAFPWLTRAINRAKDAKDLDEAAIIAAQVEACYAAFVTSGVSGYDAAEAAATSTVNGRRIEDIRPGTVRYLDRGESVHFGTPTRSAGYGPIQEWNYRRAAAGMNFPYEMLAKNWAGLSFAGGRLSLTDAKLFVKAQQKLLREAWLAAIWNRMVEESVIVGAVSIPPRLYSRAPWWFQKHEWGDPAWPYALTPGEEIDAAVTSIDNNLRSKASVVAEFGGNWEEVAEARRKERAMERDFEIEPITAEKGDAVNEPPPQKQAQTREKEAVA